MPKAIDEPFSQSSSEEKKDLSFLTSNKGKRLLSYDHYLFKCNKATDTKIYWICISNGCGVYVHTDLNHQFLTISGDHDHVARPDQLESRALREKMKNRIMNETTSITKIYDEEIAKASLSDSTAATFPTVAEYRANMSKARRKMTPVIPTGCVFEIPSPYQKTLAQEQFLLMDFYLKRGKDRVIVFATTQQLRLLFNSNVIFMDGTFSVTPSGFEQIFLIHVQHFGQGMPVVFCLMSNRKASTYTELFRRLKQEASAMNEQFQPKQIVTDFETALLPVIHQEFPTATHTGCLFHFMRSVNRKILSLGLNDDYNRCPDIRDQCKQLMALSLMPMSEVERQFKRLRTISSSTLDDLFVYFDRQWINGNIPTSMWNFHELSHRTNNISEAYNRRFGSRLEKKHPNVWTFIQLIQNENARCEHLIIQLDSGAKPAKQSNKTNAFQRRFETLKERYNKDEINAKQLLQAYGLLLGVQKN